MNDRLAWYSSFYWRIGVSFVVFVLVMLLAQSIMFSYMMARSADRLPLPSTLTATIASDVRTALARDPRLDLDAFLKGKFGHLIPRAYVVLNDGSLGGNSAQPLPEAVTEQALAMIQGTDATRASEPLGAPGFIVTAPIVVDKQLRGLVVLPLPPLPSGIVAQVGRLLSLPGTLVLIVVTGVAAVVIFAPARRRLRALEKAAIRVGEGDLGARAPEEGRDEIARVARAFNRMGDELARRDEALRRSDRLRRQMFADVSHELNTPLTALCGYLDTLQMSEISLAPVTRVRYLETLQRETQRLKRIVADLLELARYESDGLSIDSRLFDIERVFFNVVQRYEREARARDVDIRTRIEPAADQIVGDPGRIEQVIDNLVANALRHTPDGGWIELRSGLDASGCRLSVIDSGEGIAPEHIDHVFDRFYKVDAARLAGSGTGSGLGLSIAKAIVSRHGGIIGVSSRPGRTEFTILLPLQSASTNA